MRSINQSISTFVLTWPIDSLVVRRKLRQPNSWDWRDSSFIGLVKQQDSCGKPLYHVNCILLLSWVIRFLSWYCRSYAVENIFLTMICDSSFPIPTTMN